MNVKEWDRNYLWRFRGKSWKVLDGDTFILLPDAGFGLSGFPHIRIQGLYAPELSERGGVEARNNLFSLLQSGDEGDWPLRIESKIRERVVTETRSFERYVSRVFVVKHGEMLDVADVLTLLKEPGI